MQYEKVNNKRMKVTSSQSEYYDIEDLLSEENNLKFKLKRVQDLIKEAKKIGCDVPDDNP